MVVGTMSIPDEFKDKPFPWFKKWYALAMSDKPETAEEVYLAIGGKLPRKEAKKVEIQE